MNMKFFLKNEYEFIKIGENLLRNVVENCGSDFGK